MARRAPGKKRAFVRRRTGQCSITHTVAIDIKIPTKRFNLIELLRIEHLATVLATGVIPFQRLAQVLVHTQFKVAKHKYRRLQPVCQILCIGSEVKTLLNPSRKQQRVLGVAMGGIGGADQVTLLGARWHTS